MEQLISTALQAGVEVLTIVVIITATAVLAKVHSFVDKAKKKDELGIIDILTDRAVEYAEAELTGASGKQKRNFAVSRAVEMLESKGIKITEAEIIAGIENGVNKLKERELNGNSISVDGLSTGIK